MRNLGNNRHDGAVWAVSAFRWGIAHFNFRALAAMLGIGICAVFFGLLATTASPILIGLGIGLVGGVFLLSSPKTTIWLVLGLGLSTGALLSLAGPGFDKISWAIAMMAMLLWLPALMNLMRQGNVPFFIWLALLFMLQAVLSTIFFGSLGELITGFKRYFQMYGLLLAFATLAITRDDFQRWLKLLLGIALLQLPFAVYERIVLAPQRSGSVISGEATDVVAGTMGANLVGGSPNSVMALFVLVAFVFLIARWRAGVVSTAQMAGLGLLLLAPLTLGETKIVVVLLPLVGIVLLRRDFVMRPLRYLPALAGLATLTVGLAYVYVVLMLNSSFIDVFRETARYNVGNEGYGRLYLNRTTVLGFWWVMQGLHDPLGFLFGHGLGSSYGSGANAGHIAAHYPRYGIGLSTISSLLWDTGVAGVLLYVSVFVAAWRAANRLWKESHDPVVRADVLALQAAIALIMLFMPYSDSQINLMTMEIIVASVLGYLAFLIRQQKTLPVTSRSGTSD